MNEPVFTFENQLEWKCWLSKNYKSSEGIWLSLRKRGSPEPRVSHAEALDVALCFGWIDARVKRGDEHSYLQRFVPRSKKSIWSKINREHVSRLILAGEMQPSGMAEIKRAQADGRWDSAYDPQSRATVPLDLQKAFKANPRAEAFFGTLDSQNRYAVLFRLQTARTPEARIRKLHQFVAMLAEGRKLH